jgi:hypothetical protein
MPRARHPGTSVNRSHWLNRQRAAWWLAVPNLVGGRKWFDLVGSSHGTLTGGTSAAAFKPPARLGGWGHVAMDGSAGHVDCGAVLSGSYANLTIAGWMARDATNHVATFGWGDNGSFRFNILWYIDGTCYFQSGNAAATYAFASLGGTDPHRFLMTFDGSLAGNARLSAYVDGRPVSLSYAGTQTTTYAVTGTFKVGREITNNVYTAGWHDDTAVWTRTLSAAEAWADYTLSRRGYPGVLARPTSRTLMAPAAAAAALFRRNLYRRAGSRGVA